jgi:hypothetical protein
MPEIRTCIGAEQVTSLSASAPLATIPTYASWAIIKPRVQGIYLRLNGGTATSADMLIPVDTPVEVTSGLASVRMLQATAGAIADVWYFG